MQSVRPSLSGLSRCFWFSRQGAMLAEKQPRVFAIKHLHVGGTVRTGALGTARMPKWSYPMVPHPQDQARSSLQAGAQSHILILARNGFQALARRSIDCGTGAIINKLSNRPYVP